MQIPAQFKRNNQGLHSSFYAYFKSYQGIHFSLFTVHFLNLQSYNWLDEGRKRENVSFWGTPTLEICYCLTDNFKQHYNRFINSND